MAERVTLASAEKVSDRFASRVPIIAMLFLVGLINYLDRASLPVLSPVVASELKLDPGQMGVIFSGFGVGYAAFCLVGGWAVDRFKAEYVLLASVVAWSLFCGLTSTAAGFQSLFLWRVALGAGEGGFGAAANKIVGQRFSSRWRGRTIALISSGTSVGGMIAGPLMVSTASLIGWRGAFVLVASFGILWSIGWFVLARPHKRSTGPASGSSEPKTAPPAVSLASSRDSAIKSILRPSIIAIAFAFFGYSYILYFFISWFPSYLVSDRHLSSQYMSYFNAVPWAFGTIGLLVGGFGSDWLVSRMGDAVLARKMILAGGLVTAAVCVALTGIAESAAASVAFMAMAVFAMYVLGSLYFALVLDLTPVKNIGVVTGFVHFVANCAGIVAPLLTGFVVKISGTYAGAFELAAAVALLSAGGLIFVRNRPPQSAGAGAMV